MDATLRLAAPLAQTLPSTPVSLDDTEQCLMALELIEQIVDALMAGFAFNEYEEQVVHHMLFGRSCHAIGDRLGIRETTVHKHMHRVFAKTGTQDRRGLYDLALRLAAVRSIAPSPLRLAA